MIKEFKDLPMRPTGQVYQSMLTQIKKRYAKDPEQAGEMAISFIEFILTGEISSDDDIIEGFIEGYRVSTKKAQDRYDAKVDATKDSLRPIAEMLNAGMRQAEIARRLGVQPPAISKKVTQIRTKFPDLLETSGNVGKFPETLESEESLEIVSEVSENVGKVPESLGNVSYDFGKSGKVGNVSKVSNVSSDNDNEDDNDNDDDKDSSLASLGEGQGFAPTPQAASPTKRYPGKFEF
jgi:hypothetical protein